MKTREEMSAEIQAGLAELLGPLAGTGLRRADVIQLASEYIDGLRNRADVSGDIEVGDCTVDASGVATVRVRVRGDMIPLFIEAGWELKP